MTGYLVLVAFFCSGVAALFYQFVWQRALFAVYGIHAESVTVVVAAFMLGLGLGSLLGGRRSKDPGAPLLRDFSVVEAGIGVFGLISLPLIHTVGALTLLAPPALIAVLTFALLLVPTIGMGATLPLLVAHQVKATGNVGVSVATLYYVNTLGAAVGALGTVLGMFRFLGQSGTVYAAAGLNFAVSVGALVAHARSQGASRG